MKPRRLHEYTVPGQAFEVWNAHDAAIVGTRGLC
eukprot:CAMPEP_0115238892 /NCGR_PEP_ID=MMETSP0270-20121206/37117_1 /TAXON_ID=71861 /ORGANISM="Scrippsiella trochoidea, Strain CCMP3099" /LENGTH=33 /DNA_ID= /DNA_START= /DNA_END= /DNA_ORIENTATION=